MTGLDTNVLVRYIAQDDEMQARAATEFIEKHCASGGKLFVNHIVLCELVWVFKKCYKLSKSKIVIILERIVNTSQFAVENPQIIRQALFSRFFRLCCRQNKPTLPLRKNSHF